MQIINRNHIYIYIWETRPPLRWPVSGEDARNGTTVRKFQKVMLKYLSDALFSFSFLITVKMVREIENFAVREKPCLARNVTVLELSAPLMNSEFENLKFAKLSND